MPALQSRDLGSEWGSIYVPGLNPRPAPIPEHWEVGWSPSWLPYQLFKDKRIHVGSLGNVFVEGQLCTPQSLGTLTWG